MKFLSTLILAAGLLTSSGAMAGAIPDLTCTSVDTVHPMNVTLKFSSANVIDEISSGANLVWKSAPGKFDQNFTVSGYQLSRESVFLAYLSMHLGSVIGESLDVTLITSAPDSMTPAGQLPSMKRQLDKMNAPGEGIAFMSAKDASGVSVGTSLYIAWAGTFHDCK